jgi:hypothetical protein
MHFFNGSSSAGGGPENEDSESEASSSSFWSLSKLEAGFNFEIRVLYLLPIGLVVNGFSRDSGLVFIGLAVVGTICSDTYFSVAVTGVFLRPITQTLRMGGGAGSTLSPAMRNLEKTKYTTLAGCSLAVFSSTLFYINIIVGIVFQGGFVTDPWLNPIVFGVNVDSICNDVGMFMMSGSLKQLTTTATKWAATTMALKNTNKIKSDVVPLAMHGESCVAEDNVVELLQVARMTPDAVTAILERQVRNLGQLQQLAPEVTKWIVDNLAVAHEDAGLKKRLKMLLGNAFYVSNLKHLGLWDYLIQSCAEQALEMGQELHACYQSQHLRNTLGRTCPNTYGKVEHRRTTRSVRHRSLSMLSGLVQRVTLTSVEPTLPTTVVHPRPVPTSSTTAPLTVSKCDEDTCSKRLDAILPVAFPRDSTKSQFWDEKCYIHCIRMIAMAIDDKYQHIIERVCLQNSGEFMPTAIKNFGRMKNKCLSKDDHYSNPYPRPSQNIDINRNCSTFESPEDLLSFIRAMKKEPSFGGRPVRSKNMFLFSQARAKKQFHYRTVMINWLFTPGLTYQELAAEARPVWDRYLNYAHAPGFGAKDVSESWGSWRTQIKRALAYLTSPEIATYPVQFIVETQLLLSVYLQVRKKMHLLYKVVRANNPQALCNDFKSETRKEDRPYDAVQEDALQAMQDFLACTDDVNQQHPDKKGATRLWDAAEQGHVKAVRVILQHPQVNPNAVRQNSNTTPLFIAAHRGNEEVVEALLGHPDIQINWGAGRGASPLFIAAQEGREGVVEILLRHQNVELNQATGENRVTPLCIAAELGHEHIVKLLLTAKGINANHAAADGTTAMSSAASLGHLKIVEMLRRHPTLAQRMSIAPFPERYQFDSDRSHEHAVVNFCSAYCTNLPQNGADASHKKNWFGSLGLAVDECNIATGGYQVLEIPEKSSKLRPSEEVRPQ